MDSSAYQVLNDRDHVLLRPDTYIGAITNEIREDTVYNSSTKRMVVKDVVHSLGLQQIFLEVLGNASDNVQRSREAKIDPKRIEVDVFSDRVVVKNYGCGIPIMLHQQTGFYVPYVIFGMMRSSSNYDDSKKRLFIGKNGFGAKLTNIFSRRFEIFVGDSDRKKSYLQVWENNMNVVKDPEIKDYRGESFTQITYFPDFQRFNVSSFDEEAVLIYGARCVDVSYSCEIPVIFNKEKVEVKDIIAFANLFIENKETKKISYKDPEGSFDICLVDTPDEAIVRSFVNGIPTPDHGVHVDAIYAFIMSNLPNELKAELEGISFRKNDLAKYVSIFTAFRVPNPGFKSQDKRQLVKPKVKVEIPEKLMKKMAGWQMVKAIHEAILAKREKKLSKDDGKTRRSRITDIPKYTPANDAGTASSRECTIIFVEGDSALNYPRSLISNFGENGAGNNRFGLFPLKGKPLNIVNASFSQIIKNEEFKNVKKILNLKEKANYLEEKEYKTMNYGKIWLMFDADNDGKHITGLILLYLMTKCLSLVQRGCVYLYRSPIITIYKKRGGGKKKEEKEEKKGRRKKKDDDEDIEDIIDFYTYGAYKKWEATNDMKGWKTKYFKGLGTNEKRDIKRHSKHIREVKFVYDERAVESIHLAFNKTHSSQRKQWLEAFIDSQLGDNELPSMTVSEFVNREYVHYPRESNERSIPGIDGFKESQRKCFFSIVPYLKSKQVRGESKVANAAAKVSEETHYKHGEASLHKTIISMTQSFVGSNNEPLFREAGLFGTRCHGGKDAASPRYISLRNHKWIELLFRDEDKVILQRKDIDGYDIEYEQYYPVMPLILMNSQKGVGVAYATDIPPFYPPHLEKWLKNRLADQKHVNLHPETSGEDRDRLFPDPPLMPWFKGFTGVYKKRKNGFTTEGIADIQGQNIRITELPVTKWTETYNTFLNTLIESEVIQDYRNNCTDSTINYTLMRWDNEKKKLNLKNLRLITKFSFNNMTVMVERKLRNGKTELCPRIFHSPEELLAEFFEWRLEHYYTRKKKTLEKMRKEIAEAKSRHDFIQDVVEERLIVRKRAKADIYKDMDAKKYDHKFLTIGLNHLTEEELVELKQKIEGMIQDMETLEKTDPEDIWSREITEYMDNWRSRNDDVIEPVYSGEDNDDQSEGVDELEAAEENGEEENREE